MLQHLVKVDWILRKMQDMKGWPNILPDWCTLAYCGDMSKKDSVLAVLTLLSCLLNPSRGSVSNRPRQGAVR